MIFLTLNARKVRENVVLKRLYSLIRQIGPFFGDKSFGKMHFMLQKANYANCGHFVSVLSPQYVCDYYKSHVLLNWYSSRVDPPSCVQKNITFLASRNRATKSSLGIVEEFNSATTSINHNLERLEQYFAANSVPTDSAVTQTKCNPNFCYWRRGLRRSFGSLVTDSFLWENLYTAYHYPRESFHTEHSAANLKHLASTCHFESHLNEALRDRFVCGLCSPETHKKETAHRGTQLQCSTGARLRRRVSFKVTLGTVEVFRLHNFVRVFASETSAFLWQQYQIPVAVIELRKKKYPQAQRKYRNYSCHSCSKVGYMSEACKGKSQKLHQLEGLQFAYNHRKAINITFSNKASKLKGRLGASPKFYKALLSLYDMLSRKHVEAEYYRPET